MGSYINLYAINKDVDAYLYIDQTDGEIYGQFQNMEYAGGVSLSYEQLMQLRAGLDAAILRMKGADGLKVFTHHLGTLARWGAAQFIQLNANNPEAFCKFLLRVYDIETMQGLLK